MGFEDYWPWPEGTSGTQSDSVTDSTPVEAPAEIHEPELPVRESLDKILYRAFLNVIDGKPVPYDIRIEAEINRHMYKQKLPSFLINSFTPKPHEKYLNVRQLLKNQSDAKSYSLEGTIFSQLQTCLHDFYVDFLSNKYYFLGRGNAEFNSVLKEAQSLTGMPLPEKRHFDELPAPVAHDYETVGGCISLAGFIPFGLGFMQALLRFSQPYLMDTVPRFMPESLIALGIAGVVGGAYFQHFNEQRRLKQNRQNIERLDEASRYYNELQKYVHNALVRQPDEYLDGLALKLKGDRLE